jgi:hypothetical protein
MALVSSHQCSIKILSPFLPILVRFSTLLREASNTWLLVFETRQWLPLEMNFVEFGGLAEGLPSRCQGIYFLQVKLRIRSVGLANDYRLGDVKLT